ncbi:hypothetical protein WR25_19810 isoform B [Diploscapter pachys]|uniref:C3H1-type domain-containing protein n=1 Tax=Diploscapter pachys TaxID=2018661 RepID=A0A2A2LAP1_9BILA|nr:hypothetical protein WR25_19810 isoform B [Diploscapter pachys]
MSEDIEVVVIDDSDDEVNKNAQYKSRSNSPVAAKDQELIEERRMEARNMLQKLRETSMARDKQEREQRQERLDRQHSLQRRSRSRSPLRRHRSRSPPRQQRGERTSKNEPREPTPRKEQSSNKLKLDMRDVKERVLMRMMQAQNTKKSFWNWQDQSANQIPTQNQSLNLGADQSGKMSWEMSEQVIRDLGRQLKYKKNFILYKEDTFYMTDEEVEVFFGKLEPGPVHHVYKTELCRDHQQRGRCPRGLTCRFAHSPEELRTRTEITHNKKWKTVNCNNFSQTGFCRLGNECGFIHCLMTQAAVDYHIRYLQTRLHSVPVQPVVQSTQSMFPPQSAAASFSAHPFHPNSKSRFSPYHHHPAAARSSGGGSNLMSSTPSPFTVPPASLPTQLHSTYSPQAMHQSFTHNNQFTIQQSSTPTQVQVRFYSSIRAY